MAFCRMVTRGEWMRVRCWAWLRKRVLAPNRTKITLNTGSEQKKNTFLGIPVNLPENSWCRHTHKKQLGFCGRFGVAVACETLQTWSGGGLPRACSLCQTSSQSQRFQPRSRSLPLGAETKLFSQPLKRRAQGNLHEGWSGAPTSALVI